jgi:hypothetical protein
MPTMNQRMAGALTTLLVAVTAPLSAPAVAHAEPVVPQPDTQCSEELAGALTQLPDYTTFLECRSRPGVGYRWQIFDSPYPNSDRWLSYGPELTLHGEGQRNREINSGDWIAYPQDSASKCTAEQLAVVSAGKLSAPQVSTGEPGQPLKLRVLPLMFTIELSGYCLWQKVL